MPTPVTIEEAYDIITTNRGFVRSGGYVLFYQGYFAYGTFPGCCRGGPMYPNLEAFKEFSIRPGFTREWERLSLQDIIESYGYSPQVVGIFVMFESMNLTQAEKQEAYGLERDMLHYCINSEYKTDDFANGFAGSRIWKPWFAARQGLKA